MKFGLFYVLEAPDGDYRKAWTRMMGQIQFGEELGYESVWLAEHHGSLYGSMPRLAVAAAAIAPEGLCNSSFNARALLATCSFHGPS